MTSTNGIESFWATLKRGYHGTYIRWSRQHLGCYLNEFTGRANARDLDTVQQMAQMAHGTVGRRLTYRRLIGRA